MSAQPLPHVTPEEYLDADRAAEYKSEYYDGAVYAMAGGTYAHSQLIGILTGMLYAALKGRRCSLNPELRLRIANGNACVYPDLMVTCGPPEFAGDRKDSLTNPTVIIEVLSDSTEAHDRGFKFAQYRMVDSLEEYVLVSQQRPQIEVFRRQPEDRWLLSAYSGSEATCEFESIACRMPFAEIYPDVIAS